MPSCKPQHQEGRQSIRGRLATLKATASRAIGRPATADAEMLAMEAEFWSADAARIEASDRHDDASNACAHPPMPSALRVGRNDWFMPGIPQPPITHTGGGQARVHPYGLREVEILRTNPCMGVFVGGTEGELQPGGVLRRRPDEHAQARADEIITAWDEWQAEIRAAREAVGLPDLVAAHRQSFERYEAVLTRLRRSPATSLAGLAAKARVATDLVGFRSAESLRSEAERRDPDDFQGMLFSLVADLLDMAGSAARG